jgi:hypothetical protein
MFEISQNHGREDRTHESHESTRMKKVFLWCQSVCLTGYQQMVPVVCLRGADDRSLSILGFPSHHEPQTRIRVNSCHSWALGLYFESVLQMKLAHLSRPIHQPLQLLVA